MKVMIVGGTGNISTSIVSLLLECGHSVTCFNRGVNISEPLPKEVKQIHGDRHNQDFFEQTMQRENPDIAIDMICFTAKDAQSDIRAFPNVSRLIFCSTTCVYGIEYDILPVYEDYPRKPFTGYGKGKAEAEDVFLAAYYKDGYPVTIMRPSTTYGNQVGMVSNIGVNNVWIDCINKGKPLLVCGSGNNPHQFMHVKDAARAFVDCINNDKCIGQVYNLVGAGYIDWNLYYKTGMEILGKEVSLVGVSLDLLKSIKGENFGYATEIFGYNIYYDNSKIYRDIPTFRQSISLKYGMSSVIQWSLDHNTIPDSDQYPIYDKLTNKLVELRKS